MIPLGINQIKLNRIVLNLQKKRTTQKRLCKLYINLMLDNSLLNVLNIDKCSKIASQLSMDQLVNQTVNL